MYAYIFQKVSLHHKKICDIPPQGQLVTFIYHYQYDTIRIYENYSFFKPSAC